MQILISPTRVARLTLVGLAMLVMLAPLLSVIWTSFFADRVITFPPSGYTWDWYVRAWDEGSFRSGLVVSVLLAIAASFCSLLIGVPAAFVLARREFPGRNFLTLLLLSPLMLPAIVAGTGAYLFFIQIELMSGLQLAGTPLGLFLGHLVIAIPWTTRLTTSSLINFDRTVEEAAVGLGASRSTVLRRITLPLIRPALVASALFSFVVSFVELEMSLLLVGLDTVTLPIALVNYIEWRLDPAISAVSAVQIVIVAISLLVANRYIRLTSTM
jgi:putative spermidine/putrescine transport system permease protein